MTIINDPAVAYQAEEASDQPRVSEAATAQTVSTQTTSTVVSLHEYAKLQPVLLRDHPHFNEFWLQDRIADDPAILGLGEVEVRDRERPQPRAGRLDLLLRDLENGKRYEVEIMLGTVDESHIIRAIEYWDIERKRWPQYEHTAVIVAERITTRFLNVIGLFNGAIPLIAIQLSAFSVNDKIGLNFVRVLDEVALGIEETEDTPGEPTDRAYWEKRGTKESVSIVDVCFGLLREVSPGLELKYNKYYIGLSEHGRANNFVTFAPRKQFVVTDVELSDPKLWRDRLEEGSFDLFSDEPGRSRIRFRLTKSDVSKNKDLLRELLETSYRDQLD